MTDSSERKPEGPIARPVRWPIVALLTGVYAVLSTVAILKPWPNGWADLAGPYPVWILILLSIESLSIIGTRSQTPRVHALVIFAILICSLRGISFVAPTVAAELGQFGYIVVFWAPLFVLALSGLVHAGVRGVRVAVWLVEAHAVCFLLSFPPYNVWPLVFVAIAPLAIIGARARTPWRHAVMVLLICFAQWMWMCRWSIPVTAAGYPGYALIMALYPALFVLLLGKLTLQGRAFSRWPLSILAAIVWGGLEFLRGRLAFDGYPWFLIAHPTVEWNTFPQIASVVGAYGVGIIMMISAGALADVLVRSRLSRPSLAASILLGAGAWCGTVAFGVFSLQQHERSREGASGINILAIQTNLPQDNKIGWPVEQQKLDVMGFIERTRDAVAASRAAGIERVDLIVWPETMVPGAGFEHETNRLISQKFGMDFAPLTMWSERVRSLSRELGVPMLVGAPAWVGASIVADGGQITLDVRAEHNSAYLVMPDGSNQQRYDKVFLTPFGETMPYISRWPWLEQQLLALGAQGMTFNLDAADEPRLLTLPATGGAVSLATPICFEDTVSWLVREMVNASPDPSRAVIINISNDGWFGDFADGRLQHAQIARFRCIEHRIPMVRAVNTGLSVHVDSAGNLVDVIGEGRYGTAWQAGWLLAEVRFDGVHTVYSRLGDWPGWAAFAAMLGLLAVRWFDGRK